MGIRSTRRLFALLLAINTILADAQTTDAFHGIYPVTEARNRMSLNKEWMLKVVKGITEDNTVPETDGSWDHVNVPGCWERTYKKNKELMCEARYDSPEPLTGYYRTSFILPEGWKKQLVAIQFDGVLYGYDLWINGKHAGKWRSAYNTAVFDITPYIDQKKDRQDVALRVISQFPGSDFDYNDDWTPNGIFRDVTLMSVPRTHLSDITIKTRLNGEVIVTTDIANKSKHTRVTHEVLDADGNIMGNTFVSSPKLWTAETPYLYTLRTTISEKNKVLQTFNHKFGFRELTIEGNRLLLNGQPIKLRGVNCHATNPETGKVVSDELTVRDMTLMKEASVNYIRTSHYPREPRFYDLADSLGFYIVNEIPFGYGDKNLYDSTFYDTLRQRAQATVKRDKNHASVLIWSVGNENPLTDICMRLGEYIKTDLDTSRPICYPQVGSYFRRFNYDFPKVADIYAPHYPTTSQIDGFYQKADRPIIFTEYCHSLGSSFEDHKRQWEIIERTPGIAGGSVWEWVDQGMSFTDDSRQGHTTFGGYEERVYITDKQGYDMCGIKGTDGLLYADRTPLPNYYELQHNYARAFVSDITGDTLHIVNRYDFINLRDNILLHWCLRNDTDTLAMGTESPDCAPHSTTCHIIGLPDVNDKNTLLLLDILFQDTKGIKFLNQSFVLSKPDFSWYDTTKSVSQIQQGPYVRVGRKPSLAELIKVKDKRVERYIQPMDNPYVKATITSDEKYTHYRLQPDSSGLFLSETGIAYLLNKDIDRIQWIGKGPYPSYPGRDQAPQYGIWGLHKDDLYFEGNHMGVDALWASDKEGNGVYVHIPEGGNVNFEQTDKGILLTINAAVSGLGPKFAVTAFPVWSDQTAVMKGKYILQNTTGKSRPRFFKDPKHVCQPFKPFVTRYDSYLMRLEDITQ